MQPSAKSQYTGIREEALGQAAKKVASAVEPAMKKKAELNTRYTTNKYAQHRVNAEKVLGEKKAIMAEREQRGITSYGDPETGTVFPLKSEAAMKKPRKRVTRSGSMVSKAQMNGAAPTTGANS